MYIVLAYVMPSSLLSKFLEFRLETCSFMWYQTAELAHSSMLPTSTVPLAGLIRQAPCSYCAQIEPDSFTADCVIQ